MSGVTRRDAFMAMAAGAAAATGSLAAREAGAETVLSPFEGSLRTAREAALKVAAPILRSDAGPVREARVLLCRSWDRSVYLYVDDQTKGFASLDEAGFAIAAACQAADRPVSVRYWGHAPEWGAVGRFDGVLLAVDGRDLETGSPLL